MTFRRSISNERRLRVNVLLIRRTFKRKMLHSFCVLFALLTFLELYYHYYGYEIYIFLLAFAGLGVMSIYMARSFVRYRQLVKAE